MSLGQYTNFIDPTQIPQNIVWMLLGWATHFGISKLLKIHPIKINRQTIWKSYQIMKLFGRIIHFVSIVELQSIVNKLHIKRFDKWCQETGIIDLLQGFFIFQKIEPKAAKGLLLIIGKFADQYQINKITGLNKEPDLLDL